jgi:hypothetical protein
MTALLSPERPTDMAPRMLKRRRAVRGRHRWVRRERSEVDENGKRYAAIVCVGRYPNSIGPRHAARREASPEVGSAVGVYVSK